jgi:nucleotide-binding universal stress UspA family protein
MFTRILVPLDGTPDAAAALQYARALASTEHVEIMLVRVVEADDETTRAEADSYLESQVASLRSDSMTVQSQVLVGEPEIAIIEAAEAHRADLIVMATHGRVGIARAVIGSVTAGVLEHSRLPLLVVRSQAHAVEAIRTLLVPLDGSPGGALALEAARDLAQPTGARIVLLQVVEPLARFLRGKYIDPEWEEEHRLAAQAYLDRLASALERAGYHASGQAVIGRVAESIAEQAQVTGADLIVMSTHALTGPARGLLGSVADEVVRTADRGVLLVRRPQE